MLLSLDEEATHALAMVRLSGEIVYPSASVCARVRTPACRLVYDVT